jgi:hypothetical protein
MRLVLALVVALVAGCSDPALNARLRLGADGLQIAPSVSGRVGGLGIAVSP